uniref:Uncharacterized protein n=1 Tax=Anguilla anguilla TaxID=7936 RepID=A0A0E9SYY8_ANGAN
MGPAACGPASGLINVFISVLCVSAGDGVAGSVSVLSAEGGL